MGKCSDLYRVSLPVWAVLFIVFLFLPAGARAEASAQCAKVKIEVKQELTLERQAFDAHMKINNGLTHAALGDIRVDVWFTDEAGDPVLASSDPDNTSALFFIQVDSLDNISDVSGTGAVPPDSAADIHWLIIPAPGASNGLASGTLYNVGATLTYTVGGEENVIEVSPDYIFVKPMPELSLDYFLPKQVYGDDPFTAAIEPSIPFSLGLRVKNGGSGTVNELKIDSAQPKIVDNDQGLLVNFQILGSQVNGMAVPESLLVDFGAISSGDSGTARWTMACTLSGKFVDFGATFSHADELGGELTSLISQVNTHTLVRDVLVDLPGRDTIRDFLSGEAGVYEVYESDGTQTNVTDQSAASTITFKETAGGLSYYTLTATPAPGFVLTSLADPLGGAMILKEVVRSDGKTIKPENAWLSSIQDSDTHEWHYFVNIFDTDTTGAYTLVYDAASSAAQAPVLQFIPGKSVIETQTLSFVVEASDPNGTVPSLSADPMPVGALFTDSQDGQGIFEWTPTPGQKGGYYITFTASDGSLSADQQVKIVVYDQGDSDMDGMPDDWEILYFGSISRDGTMDFDNDGVSDLQEYLDQTDPTLDEAAPSIPDPLYPDPNVAVADDTPELVIENSADPQNDAIDYSFEIYSDPQMTDMVADQDGVAQNTQTAPQTSPPPALEGEAVTARAYLPPPGVTTTNWEVPVGLADNTRYYWRVRSSDVDGASLWAYYDFFVNTQNDPPAPFHGASPGDDAQVDSLTPTLMVMNATDPDLDPLFYTFRVYEDPAMTILAAESGAISQADGGVTAWTAAIALADNTQYFWQAVASDGNGGQTASTLLSFTTNTANHAPSAPELISPAIDEEIDTAGVQLQAGNATDPDNDSLSYLFEIDTSPTFDSADKQTSGQVPAGTDPTAFYASGLLENQTCYWRVKASDGQAQSPWTTGRFFVNRINDAPSVPSMKNPGTDAWVETLTPVLSMHTAIDPDNDPLEYQFEIYTDEAMNHFTAQADSQETDITISPGLANNTAYFWRARALDHHGVPSNWTPVSRFFVKDATVNALPTIEMLQPFEDLLTNATTFEIQWSDDDPDSSAHISLFYDYDAQGEDGILIFSGIEEDPDGAGDIHSWDISSLDDGTYYIYAVIADQAGNAAQYAPGSLTIDRTPPQAAITPASGSYDTPQAVELASSEPGDIFYTTDGSDPTPLSFLYTAPFTVDAPTTVKYMARDQAGNSSPISEASYQFNTGEITLNLSDNNGNPVEKAKVYLFKDTGAYAGRNAKTDGQGNALFDPDTVAPGAYKFRIDLLGHQFWTQTVQLPQEMYTAHVIPFETVEIMVMAAGNPAVGNKVYLYSGSGKYLGVHLKTDSQGKAAFLLPAGVSYKFRADVLGTKYWTDAFMVQSGGATTIDLDTGGGIFTVKLQKDDNTPIQGINLYLFAPSGKYLGQKLKTATDGQASFAVSNGAYTVRADYLGYKFWTDTVTMTQDTLYDFTLAHTDVTLTVSGVYQSDATPLEKVKVYLFTPSGKYIGQNQKTNAQGQVSFSLPDKSFQVRADYMKQQFWSEAFTGEDTPVDIAMAKAQVSVTGAGLPQTGVKVYLYSASGKYLGQYRKTDAAGQVTFTVPEGAYKFRADYEGAKFWSPEAGLAAHMTTPVEVSVGGGTFIFQAQKETGEPLAGVKTHVYTTKPAYIGLKGATDADGKVPFDLADGTYLFRFNYLGHKFWSDPVTIPDQMAYTMALDHSDVQVSVSTRHTPCKEVKVHLFSESGAYLGQYLKTNDTGDALFNLPAGLTFKFRATVLGNKYVSDPIAVTPDDANTVDLDTGGGLLTATLQKDDLIPIPDVKLYLFSDSGAYKGQKQTTDAQGQAAFDVPQGTYKIRADYRGYKFWSNPALVIDDTPLDITLPHTDVTITIQAQFQGDTPPLTGIKAFLFNEAGNYLGQNALTNANGQVAFSLPNQAYKVRADYMKSKFWTDPFTSQDTTLTIPQGKVKIHLTQSGADLADAKAYLYREDGTYLGLWQKTGSDGTAQFPAPAGQTCKIRVNTKAKKTWTDPFTIPADQTIDIDLEIN